MQGISEGNYQYFSLLKKITTIICYDSCQTCVLEQSGNYEYNHCINCSNNYYPIYTTDPIDLKEGINCYNKDDSRVENYYLESDNKFHLCDESCKTCNDSSHCISCNKDYYFKTLNNKIVEGLCWSANTQKYYLDLEANIIYKNLNNEIVLKPCYDTCLTCKEEGSYKNNNCMKCDEEKQITKYPFSDSQCTNKTENCLKNKEFWIFKDNNIICVKECNDFVIYDEGQNQGLCVEDCQDFNNPYLSTKTYFKLTNCGEHKYCIPSDKCFEGIQNKRFRLDIESLTCNKIGDCNISAFDEEDFFNKTDLIDSSLNIKQRAIIWRMLEKEEDYLNYQNNYDVNLIETYKDLHEKLVNSENEASGIFLILSINYNNFNITIYPMNLENFVYERIIQNNLSFIFFKEGQDEYDIYDEYILIFLFERIYSNSAINELNYFFINFNDDEYTYSKIDNLNNLGINEPLNAFYTLKNYINDDSFINKRNKESLVDNIKNMYKSNPEFDLSNIDDPFYNDICVLYTSDFKR